MCSRNLQPRSRGGIGALQKLDRRGFDTVRRQHAAHQIAMAAILAFNIGNGVVQALKAALLIEDRHHLARCFQHHAARTVGGAEIDTQTQFARGLRSRVELGDRFTPFTVKQRRNGSGSGDTVQQQLAESEPLLKGQRLLRVHFIRTSFDIGTRPDAALCPTGMIVDAQDGRIEIRQCVEIDQSRADQGIAEVDSARHFAGETVPDE